jgi:membrane dipeptidase
VSAPSPHPEARPASDGDDWIVDAHLDLASNALQANRDLRESVQVLRVREAGEAGPGRGRNTVALPELRAGGVRLCFGTLLARSSGRPRPHVDFDSVEQANAVAHGQLAYYRAMERSGHMHLIADGSALDAHAAAAAGGEAALPLGVMVVMEGADPIIQPEDVHAWAADGLRALSLAHYGPGRYAGGTGTGNGLTKLGRALLRELPSAGVALDLVHLADAGFWQSLEAFSGPVHVSHANCRALVPNQRQLTDDQVRAVVERGGVIGVALDAWMLVPGWVKGKTTPVGVRLERVLDHIAHMCELVGGTHGVGIGSDLDGGYGTEQTPEDLDTVADLARLGTMLRLRGFSAEDVSRVLHGNWLRWMRESLAGSPS